MAHAWEASESWAAWSCANPSRCDEWHCARCGHHSGPYGDRNGGFSFGGKWYKLAESVFFCSEPDMTRAMRAEYGSEPWIDDAIEAQRDTFRPDRRKAAQS